MHSHCIATRTLSNYYYRDRRRTSDGARARRARRPRWHQRRGRRPYGASKLTDRDEENQLNGAESRGGLGGFTAHGRG